MASHSRFTLSYGFHYEVVDGPSLAALKKFKHEQDLHEDSGTLDELVPVRMTFTVTDITNHKIVIRVTALEHFDSQAIEEDDVTIIGWYQRSKVRISYGPKARYGVL